MWGGEAYHLYFGISRKAEFTRFNGRRRAWKAWSFLRILSVANAYTVRGFAMRCARKVGFFEGGRGLRSPHHTTPQAAWGLGGGDGVALEVFF